MLNNLHPIRLDLPGRSIMTADVCNETPQMKLPLPREKTNHWMKKDIQSTSRDTQDVIDINYSQFKNKLIDSKNHNSTFHKGNNFIISGNIDSVIKVIIKTKDIGHPVSRVFL